MTDVRCIVQSRERQSISYTLSIEAKGHAEDAITCCAITQTLNNLALWLESTPEHIIGKPTIKLESGDVLIECIGDDYATEAYWMAIIGLVNIEHAKPNSISVRIDEPL